MIADKTTPKLRKRFLEEIKKSRETNQERGFYICIEENGKLSAGDTCIGEKCSIVFQHPSTQCSGKKVQGDFHTHPYLDDLRKELGLEYKKVKSANVSSDKLLKSAVDLFLKERGMTATIPTHADVRTALIRKCAKSTEGTVCIGSDLDESKVECWTTQQVDDGDCIKAIMEEISPDEEVHKLPKEWIKPLFDKEFINIRSSRPNSRPKG